MKTLFPGYFTPTEEEFNSLWSDCQFGFDANVLLGLYRSSTETQKVFFAVLEKIADRIFLPHQAAYEYLQNRLGVISVRADSYGKIRSESDKLTKFLESIIQEHAIPNGTEILTVAKDAAKMMVRPNGFEFWDILVRPLPRSVVAAGEPLNLTCLEKHPPTDAARHDLAHGNQVFQGPDRYA